MKNKKEFGLSTLKSNMTSNAKGFLSDLQEEIVQEEQDSLKDFIKGAYRLIVEKEQKVIELERDIVSIREAIDSATQGEWEKMSKIRIPARFFKEETLRKHGHSLIEGGSEIRFMDLYNVEK